MESYYTQNDHYRLSHCYTGLLASHYNLTQENLSFPGSSLQSMQWNLMWWLDNHSDDYIKQSLILVGLTDESRISWYNPNHTKDRDDPPWNNYLHAQWLEGAGTNVERGWFDLHKHYLSMSACNELYKLNYDTTTHMFDGVAARYNTPTLQFNLLSTNVSNLSTWYNIDVHSIVNNNYKKNGHPNEQGHKNISSYLIKIIDNSI